MIGHGSVDHNGKNGKLRVTRIRYTITGTKRHVKGTFLFSVDYLRKGVSKGI